MSNTRVENLGEASRAERRAPDQLLQPVALVDLLDRLLGAGVVLSGDLVISLAGVDLVQIRLHALIASVRREMWATGRGAELAAEVERHPEDRDDGE